MNNTSITVFTILNFVFGIFSLFAILFLALGLMYGLFLSGDTGKDLMAGILGTIILITPPIVGAVCFSAAGFGLLKRAKWGYYFHIASAILAAFSCIGIIYTVFGLLYAFKPEFKSEFFT